LPGNRREMPHSLAGLDTGLLNEERAMYIVKKQDA
jgi:hypothetical protein